MRIPQILNLLALAAGLCAAGCATTDTDDNSDDNTSTAASDLTGGVPTGVRCTNKAWAVNFLSDTNHTTVVGTMSCTCYGPELLAGVESNTTALVFQRACDFN